MGKRLYRIFEKDLPLQINALCGTTINVVLKNKKTVHGILVSAGKTEIVVMDPRHDKHSIKLEDISEVVYDKEAAF